MSGGSTITVAVIGAGYAGVTAANRLRASLTPDEAARVRVVVYTPRPEFLEKVRLHELAAGSRASAARPMSDIMRDGIDVVVGSVERIDAAGHLLEVTTPDGGRRDRYDYLIYAVGSIGRAPDGALAVAEARDAEEIRSRLAGAGSAFPVVVVGGGATGVEAAAEIAEANPNVQVTLVASGRLLESLPAGARRYVSRALDRLHVAVVDGQRVHDVAEHEVVLASGIRLPAQLTVWAGPPALPRLAAVSGLPVDAAGRLELDATLRSVGDEAVFGAGDAVHVRGEAAAHLRMSCAAAIPMGGHAANSVLAELRGELRLRLDFGYLIQCYSLGRRRGLIQFVTAADVPRRLRLTGSAGAKVKESICKMVVTGPAKEGRKPNSYFAPKGPKPTASRVR